MNRRGVGSYSCCSSPGHVRALSEAGSHGWDAGASDASPGVPGGLRADLGLQLSAGQCNNSNKNHGDNDNKVIMVMMMSLQQTAV